MMKWIISLLWIGAVNCATPDSGRPFQELLDLFGIVPTSCTADAAQLWMQKGKERWEYDNRYEEMRLQVWPLFQEMRLLAEISPSQTRYDYALVHGALLTRVQARVDFLVSLCKSGVVFRKFVFLAGARPLLAPEKAKTGKKTEGEMVRWVYEHSDLPKEIPAAFIEVPMKPKGARPDTADTIAAWFETTPAAGSCLAISNQPYVAYQDAVFKSLMRTGFSLETAGPAIDSAPSVALILDTIARELLFLNAH